MIILWKPISISEVSALLLSERQCHRLQLNLESTNLPTLKSFGNSAIIPNGKVQICVAVDLVDAVLTAYVVSDFLLPAYILFGQTFTELSSVRVYKTDKELTLYQVTQNNTNSIIVDPLNDHQLLGETKEEVNSPSNYTGFVAITSDVRPGNKSYYFILPGLYVINNGKGHIVIINSICTQLLVFPIK